MHLFSSHWSEISRLFPLYPTLTPKETTETKQSALKVHSYCNTSGSPVDLCIVYLWPRIKDAMTAAKGPIGFQTIWGLTLVANIIRQWHPGQLKRCGVRTGPKKKQVFFSLLKTSQNRHPYLSYKSSRKNHEKSVKSSCFVLFQVSPHREKKSTDSCVLPKKKERAVFQNGEGIAGTAIKTR